MTRVLLALIAFYQRWVSPALGPRCRFAPSCSSYAAEALRVHGLLRGTRLAVWRVLRCHPFHPGGHDPVPARTSRSLGRAHAAGQGKMDPTDLHVSAPPSEALHPASTRSRAGAP